MDALRKVYHRAVQIPLENVETLWSELETFETNLNRITASITSLYRGALLTLTRIHPGKKVSE